MAAAAPAGPARRSRGAVAPTLPRSPDNSSLFGIFLLKTAVFPQQNIRPRLLTRGPEIWVLASSRGKAKLGWDPCGAGAGHRAERGGKL